MKEQVPVSSIMTKNIIKLNLTDDLTKAEALFISNKIKHIPVVNDCKIVGILSLNDMLIVLNYYTTIYIYYIHKILNKFLIVTYNCITIDYLFI